jgi:hypothetical protein
MTVSYSSGVYILGTSAKNAVFKAYSDFNNHMLPKKIAILELAAIVAGMQKKCFDDNDIEGNTKRLHDMFSPGGGEKTVAVVISLGFLDGATSIQDFVDGGVATIQMSNQGFFKIQQPWINEVCRAKNYSDVEQLLKPVEYVMHLIDKHILTFLTSKRKGINGVYLYVEKKPKLGNASVLLKYYHDKYGYDELHEFADDEYHYMGKLYQPKSASPTRSKSSGSAHSKSSGSARSKSSGSDRSKSSGSTRSKSSGSTRSKSSGSTRKKSTSSNQSKSSGSSI